MSTEREACSRLIEQWEARARKAFPTDAMLINRHIRELHEALAQPVAAEPEQDPAPQQAAAEPEDEAYPHDWRRIAINAIADHRNLLKECDRLSALVKQHAAAEQSQDAERWQFVLEHAVSGKAPKDRGFDITYVPVGHNGSEWGRIEIEWRGAKWEHITADGVNAIIDAARAAQAQGGAK